MRDSSSRLLPLFIFYFLGDESDQSSPVPLCIPHVGVDIDFVAIAPNPAPEGRMHLLDAVKISGYHQNEISWYWLGLS